MKYLGSLLIVLTLAGCSASAEMCEEYYSKGYEEGKDEGYETGYEEGHEEGYDEGYGIVEEICEGDATCNDYY
jgi:predicted transposase YdaD